jgi:excisionase family DNA binding protein
MRAVIREELARSHQPRRADADGLLSVSEAAAIAALKPATIRDWARTGRLKTAGRAGRRWRFRREDVEAALRGPSRTTADIDLDREAARLLSLDRARERR